MSSPSRIDLYKEAMNLERERMTLQGKLDQLHARLAQLKGALLSQNGSAASLISGMPRAATGKAAASGTVRKERGALKQQILEALAAAGEDGLRVKDLAAAIGSKPATLHSWFQFARKSIRAIRKAGKGRYRLVGALPKAATPATAKPKTAPKTGSTSRKSTGSPRGHISDAIHTALQAAGKDGARVADLAKTIGVNPRNLFVWFATTGKKFKAIKKVAPGHYFLQS